MSYFKTHTELVSLSHEIQEQFHLHEDDPWAQKAYAIAHGYLAADADRKARDESWVYLRLRQEPMGEPQLRIHCALRRRRRDAVPCLRMKRVADALAQVRLAMPTEQELTALAERLENIRMIDDSCKPLNYPEFLLAQGYLALKAERDGFKAQLEQLQAWAKLVVADNKARFTEPELRGVEL